MKKLLFVLLMVLALPVCASAEIYKNYEYNFQVDVPISWIPTENKAAIFTFANRTSSGNTGVLTIDAFYEPDAPITLKNLDAEEKDAFAKTYLAEIKKAFPQTNFLKEEFLYKQNNENSVLLILLQGKNKQNLDCSYSGMVFISNKVFYSFALLTDDLSGQHRLQFMKIFNTFKYLES